MAAARAVEVRPLSPGMRRLLRVGSGATLVGGFLAFVLASRTDRFFAWTIEPPLTAAFFGANYWAAFLFTVAARRQRAWAHARFVVPAIVLFTTLTLVATLIDLDRFHLEGPGLIARVVAWVWLVLYVIVPPATVIVVAGQLRGPGIDPPREAPLPAWLRVAFGVHALTLIVLGTALFAAPEDVAWPWALSQLTGRAVGAWLLGLGVPTALLIWENDWRRSTVGLVGYVGVGALQLIALAIFGEAVQWDGTAAWLYLGFLLTVLVVGVVGLSMARRAMAP